MNKNIEQFLKQIFFKSVLAGFFLIALDAKSVSFAAAPPAYAANVGYTANTFSSTFTKETVDIDNTGKKGFQWYPWRLFGSTTNLNALVLNSDGSITLNGDTTGPNGELVTASPSNNAKKYVGTAFGGGAYIEAVLKFDPKTVAATNTKGWPSFWSLAYEASIAQNDRWPGQFVTYIHAVEADFFEYLFLPYNLPENIYGGGMHDWYGIPNFTCKPGLCQASIPSNYGQRTAPQGTDFTQYHRYGFLWVPATSTKMGSATFYFDGTPVGQSYTWTQYTNQNPTPNGQSWAFGVLDQQHLVLILGTGVSEPMTVKSVNVWQAGTGGNLQN